MIKSGPDSVDGKEMSITPFPVDYQDDVVSLY
jgi:hypothetical protein